MEWSLSRAGAGNVRFHTSPLGAAWEAKPPLSRACPSIPFIAIDDHEILHAGGRGYGEIPVVR